MSATDTSAPLDLDAIDAFRIVTDDDGRVVTMSREEWGRVASDVTQATHKQCTLRHVAVEAALEWDIVEIVPPGKPSRDAIVAEVRRLRGQFAACVEALGVVVPPDATAAEAIVHEWQMATGEARALRMARDAAEEETARVRELFAESADAFDRLVIKVWRAATGDEHEGPASVDDLIATLRTMRATARREGAEAMREAAAQEAARNGNEWARRERRCDCGLSFAGLASAESVTATIRALPLPEVDAGQRDVTAYRAGAAKMREACVDALNAMAHAEGIDAERFRLTRGEDSAAEHHHKRAALLEARVTVLGLPLPEVTP